MVKTKKDIKTEDKSVKKTKIKIAPYVGLGRRKRSVARVWLWEKKGDLMVNGKDINEYFISEKDQLLWKEPFHTVGVSHPLARFSGSVKVRGGGITGHIGAVQLGVARALLKYNEDFREKLRGGGFLTRDSREVERKKPYLRKARKRQQYSKR